MSGSAVRECTLGRSECLVMGTGPPLVLLPGLAPENGRPVGLMRAAEIQTMGLFARRFTTYWVGRPVGIEAGESFAGITRTLAGSLRTGFDAAVNVLGISTGGSLAQQLAAEHPDLVRRLVLMSTGYRLVGHGAATQRAMIEVAERGRPRSLMAAFARDVVPPWRGRTVAAAAMYAIGLKLYPSARDVGDLHAMLVAEAAFDLRSLPTIVAKSLIISGGKDRFYDLETVRETARLIPNSRLSVFPDRGHITVLSDHGAVDQAVSFLSATDDY